VYEQQTFGRSFNERPLARAAHRSACASTVKSAGILIGYTTHPTGFSLSYTVIQAANQPLLSKKWQNGYPSKKIGPGFGHSPCSDSDKLS
jgi:hypothetical protein